jgi:hypothetical protein
MSKDPEILKLEAEIAENKAKIAQLEERNRRSGRSLAIRELSEMTDSEKIGAYDALHTSALNYVERVETSGYSDDDEHHYAWEEFLSIVARDKNVFWKYYNKLTNN